MIHVELVLENEKTAACFGEAFELVEEASEDYPWSEDLKEAVEKLKYVMENMMFIKKIEKTKKHKPDNGTHFLPGMDDGLFTNN